MDLKNCFRDWVGREIVIYSGSIKYRGILEEVLDDDFLILASVAVINQALKETVEYEECVLNVNNISGIAFEERVGRGEELT